MTVASKAAKAKKLPVTIHQCTQLINIFIHSRIKHVSCQRPKFGFSKKWTIYQWQLFAAASMVGTQGKGLGVAAGQPKPNWIHSMKNAYLKALLAPLASAAMLALVTGCATVGETNRKQLMLVSQDQEMQLGLSSFNQMKQEVPISRDPQANALVQRVGKRIAAVANLPNAQWEFVVFESPEANAFCLPGGKIGVYTGILPITQNDAGLATVIGHEVAHAYAHHGAERMSEAMGMQAVGQLLGASVANSDPKLQAATMLAYGVGSKLGRELPHSRAQESEADHIGLLYMARAGYDPREAVNFWQRFAAYSAKSGSSAGPAFLRTHPLDETRIKQLQQWMPEAEKQYWPGKAN